MARHRKKIIDAMSAIVLFALFALDAMLWRNIFGFATAHARSPDASDTAIIQRVVTPR